jgi:hypothetical protein
MNDNGNDEESSGAGKRRRWLVGAEPLFEGGWLHRGKRAQGWDVEDELIAVSILGDVTVDLSAARSTPAQIDIHAYAIGRDVDVLVGPGTQVELSGRARNDHLNNSVAAVPEDRRSHLVRIKGHTLLGDVTVHSAGSHQ